jgi:fructose-1,6-bisphosphatase
VHVDDHGTIGTVYGTRQTDVGVLCGVWRQEEFLTKSTPDKNLIRLLTCMGEALRTIAFKVRTASCGGTACVNSFGDEQLAVDMLANKLLFDV